MISFTSCFIGGAGYQKISYGKKVQFEFPIILSCFLSLLDNFPTYPSFFISVLRHRICEHAGHLNPHNNGINEAYPSQRHQIEKSNSKHKAIRS